MAKITIFSVLWPKPPFFSVQELILPILKLNLKFLLVLNHHRRDRASIERLGGQVIHAPNTRTYSHFFSCGSCGLVDLVVVEVPVQR